MPEDEVDLGKAKGIVSGLMILAVIGLILGLVGYVAFAGTVDEGDRAVLKTHGEVTDTLDPGLHYPIIPVYHSTEHIEVRPQTYTMSGDVHEGDVDSEDAVDFFSDDNQQVGVDVTVRYSVNEGQVGQYHTDWNDHATFEERLLRPVTIDVVAEQGSAFEATEAHSDEGRNELRGTIAEALSEQAPAEVTIEEVQVRDVHLDPAYIDTLEEVQRAEERADAAREEAQGEADAERIRAEGDAEAMEIRNEQITEQILALEQIEAYDEGTVYVVDPNSDTLMQIDRSEIDDDEDWGDDD